MADRPVIADDGTQLPVSGWLGMAKEAYKNEEMMGVRLYARGKIVGVTRDFNQPAGFTGEFATRSYLVGQVEAEWLDLDEGDDLVRTDRQDILWDSEYGQLLRNWGADLIREIGRISKEPRRVRVREEFMKRSNIQERAKEKYGDRDVARVAVELAKKFGGFAAEDELKDDDYVADLSEIILSVAPHQALMEAFHELAAQADRGDASLQQLTDIFDKVRIAELASYAQIASQRVRVIKELQEIIEKSLDERSFRHCSRGRSGSSSLRGLSLPRIRAQVVQAGFRALLEAENWRDGYAGHRLLGQASGFYARKHWRHASHRGD